MKRLTISPLIIGLIFLISLAGIYHLAGQKPPTSSSIYHPTDIVSPTPAPKNICLSNSECGAGKYCQQICTNSPNGTCSPGKCVPEAPV